ncbi:hypothetical protein PHYSODRAFT_510889, partial [Phytophthora sojae]
LARTVLGSLECSSLGPPPQIPRGPATRAPRAGLLRLRSSQPRASIGPLLYHIHHPHQKKTVYVSTLRPLQPEVRHRYLDR